MTAIDVAGLRRSFGDNHVLTGVDLHLDKERHILEGVLCTPVSDAELIVGKLCGSAIPSVVISWLCFFVYTVLVNLLGEPFAGRYFLPHRQLVGAHGAGGAGAGGVRHSVGGVAVLPRGVVSGGQLDRRFRGTADRADRRRPDERRHAVRSVAARGHRPGVLVIDALVLRWLVATFDRVGVVASFL